jgi:hypothetical protein
VKLSNNFTGLKPKVERRLIAAVNRCATQKPHQPKPHQPKTAAAEFFSGQ